MSRNYIHPASPISRETCKTHREITKVVEDIASKKIVISAEILYKAIYFHLNVRDISEIRDNEDDLAEVYHMMFGLISVKD